RAIHLTPLFDSLIQPDTSSSTSRSSISTFAVPVNRGAFSLDRLRFGHRLPLFARCSYLLPINFFPFLRAGDIFLRCIATFVLLQLLKVLTDLVPHLFAVFVAVTLRITNNLCINSQFESAQDPAPGFHHDAPAGANSVIKVRQWCLD